MDSRFQQVADAVNGLYDLLEQGDFKGLPGVPSVGIGEDGKPQYRIEDVAEALGVTTETLQLLYDLSAYTRDPQPGKTH